MSVAATLLGLVSAAGAAPITYNVHREIGASSVVGTITTDGTIGILETQSILRWSLNLDGGTAADGLLLTELNSAALVQGDRLIATDSALSFDFGSVAPTFPFSFLLIQYPHIGSGSNWWCVETGGCSEGTGNEESVGGPTGRGSYERRSGMVEIGQAASEIPEPGTLALLSAAAFGFTAVRRKSRA